MGKRYLADTNVLFNNPTILEKFDVVIPSHVLREVEHLELTRKQDRVLQAQIRRFKRLLDENEHIYVDLKDYTFNLRDDWDGQYTDNILVQVCLENGYGLLSNDRLLKEKCRMYDIEVVDLSAIDNEEDDYKGYIEVEMTKDEYKDFHDTRLDKNEFDLLTNQYLIVNDADTGEAIQSFKWNGEFYIHIDGKRIQSRHLGEFKAYDQIQACAIDSVRHNKFTLLRGKAGTAKTQIAISYAMQQLQSGKHDKIIVFSNAVPTLNAHYHGMVKGDLTTKLMDSSVGNILASKLGSYDQVQAMMLTEELMILPASDIRGFDSNGMNAVIIITEGQNWSVELLKLAIQRTGEDCSLIIEGDRDTQLDSIEFSGTNNGMYRASKVFRGQPYFGEVELKHIYRSEIASRAELMSEFI